MKKKLALIILSVIAAICCAVGLAACGGTEHQHTLEHTDAVAATCTVDGNVEYWRCSGCGKYYSDEAATTEITETVILALGHSWNDGVVTTEPTCTGTGVKTYTCTVCNATDTEVIAATGHTEVTDEAVAPTCTETGLTEGKHCSVCEEVLTAQEEVPATGHNYVGDVCTVCGEKRAPGLYDADYKLLATYSESGMDVTTDYTSSNYQTETTSPYYILKNTYTDTAHIVLPDTVNKIGKYAFYNCSYFISINIPKDVTSIGSSAFVGCGTLTDIYFGGDVKGWLSISGLSYLMQYGSSNKNLYFDNVLVKEITIPESVESIGEYAFYNCASLTSVTIGSGVTSIGNSAFYGCALLKVSIPDGVMSIANNAFRNCASLTSVTIGSGVTSIANSMFYDCKSLTSVTLGSNVTSIGEHAFQNCVKLTDITIPEKVTSIGSHAFYYCESLTSMTIPAEVTSIANNAFYNCKKLASIIIPEKVTSIGNYAFNYCVSLTSVYYSGTNENWSSINIGTNNTYLTNATIYYYSENAPTLTDDGTYYDGNYWHYDTDGVTPVVWTKKTAE